MCPVTKSVPRLVLTGGHPCAPYGKENVPLMTHCCQKVSTCQLQLLPFQAFLLHDTFKLRGWAVDWQSGKPSTGFPSGIRRRWYPQDPLAALEFVAGGLRPSASGSDARCLEPPFSFLIIIVQQIAQYVPCQELSKEAQSSCTIKRPLKGGA